MKTNAKTLKEVPSLKAVSVEKAYAVRIGNDWVEIRFSKEPIKTKVTTETSNGIKFTCVHHIGGKIWKCYKLSVWQTFAEVFGWEVPTEKKVVKLPDEFVDENWRKARIGR